MTEQLPPPWVDIGRHDRRDDLGGLLVEMQRDCERLIDMLNRYGSLWCPEGRGNPDVERLPLLAARIVAADLNQPKGRT